MVAVRALLAGACLALAGCGAPPLPEGPRAVTSAQDFADLAVGRDLADPQTGAVLRIVANGSWLERRANHIAASGTWAWIGAQWCHEGRRDGALFARRCAPVIADGASVSLGDRVLRR